MQCKVESQEALTVRQPTSSWAAPPYADVRGCVTHAAGWVLAYAGVRGCVTHAAGWVLAYAGKWLTILKVKTYTHPADPPTGHSSLVKAAHRFRILG